MGCVVTVARTSFDDVSLLLEFDDGPLPMIVDMDREQARGLAAAMVRAAERTLTPVRPFHAETLCAEVKVERSESEACLDSVPDSAVGTGPLHEAPA